MTSEAILALLKFAGPVVGLASALWSTTQKITYEAADGAKRLTLQGRVLVGIIIASTAISVLALGLETVIRRDAARDAKRDAAAREAAQKLAEAEKARAEEEKEAQRRSERAQRSQAEALARLEADARESKRFLEQRFLILGAAAEQQRRAAQISQQVAGEANRRLADAARSFAEFERINYPLRSVAVRVELALNFAGVDIGAFWAGIAAAEGVRLDQKRAHGDFDLVTFEFRNLDQRLDPQDIIDRALYGTDITLTFVPAPGRTVAAAAGGAARPGPRASVGGLPLKIDLTPGEILADLGERTIRASFTGTHVPAVEGVVGGAKLSLSDVDALVPVLTIRRTAAGRGPDKVVEISFSLNGQNRFHASPGVGLVDEATFRLEPGEFD